MPSTIRPAITIVRPSVLSGHFDDVKSRDPLSDFIGGTPADDHLLGTPGDDTIFAQAGHDFVRALAGNDFVHGHEGNDYLRGDAGDDSLHGDEGDDYVRGGADDDIMFGGAGYDRAAFFGASGGVHVSLLLQGGPQDTGDGMDWLYEFEHLSGTKFNDQLIGDAGDNWLWGDVSGDDPGTGGGNDSLYGGGGDDLLEVGTGNHVLFGQNGVDSVSMFSNGTDTLGGVAIDLNLQSGFGQATGQGMVFLKSVENLSGSIHDDLFTGNGHSNILAGRDGDDTLLGQGGADQLWGDGSIRVDVLQGTSGPIVFLSQELDPAGVGPAGDDVLKGGGGGDFIVGGFGGDTLTGGAGADTFYYRVVEDSLPGHSDVITDLQARDVVHLKDIDADVSTAVTNESFHFVRAFSGTATEAWLHYDAGLDLTYLELDVNGDAEADAIIKFIGHITPAFTFVM